MHSEEVERTEVPRMEALARREKHLGIDYQDTLESRNNLAVVYRFQGRYDTVDVLHHRALNIDGLQETSSGRRS